MVQAHLIQQWIDKGLEMIMVVIIIVIPLEWGEMKASLGAGCWEAGWEHSLPDGQRVGVPLFRLLLPPSPEEPSAI